VFFAFVIYTGIFIHPVVDINHKRQTSGYVKIRKLMAGLERYKADCGQYPSLAEGLYALVHNPGAAGWRGPYIDGEVPADPWGRAFEYHLENLQPEIVSYGADGKPGGEFFDMDLSSRNMWAISPQSPFEIRAQRIMIAVWFGAWVGFLGCLSLLWMNRRRSLAQPVTSRSNHFK
jgi:general secretion pathway protein G